MDLSSQTSETEDTTSRWVTPHSYYINMMVDPVGKEHSSATGWSIARRSKSVLEKAITSTTVQSIVDQQMSQ
jgi:hypothetical protein